MADEGIYHIAPTNEWMVLADRSIHKTREAALGHLNADAINLELKQFEDELAASAYDELYRPAEPAGIVQRGPLAGNPKAAKPEYIPDERAIKTHVSRVLSGARRYLEWKQAN